MLFSVIHRMDFVLKYIAIMVSFEKTNNFKHRGIRNEIWMVSMKLFV